jgi:hypothetical protein
MYELLKSYRSSLSETKQLDDTFQAFQASYVKLNVLKNPPSAKVLTAMVEEAQHLLEAAQNLQLSRTESDISQAFKIKRTPYDDLVDKWNHERGLKPLELEHELLLKRISEGGHSGQFLSDVFLSAYHRFDVPFDHCLGELTLLDDEAFRLFHGILHISHVRDRKEYELYKLAKQIDFLNGVKAQQEKQA